MMIFGLVFATSGGLGLLPRVFVIIKYILKEE